MSTVAASRRLRLPLLATGALVAVVLVAVAVVFQPWRLFTSTVVDDAIPAVGASQPATIAASAAGTGVAGSAASTRSATSAPVDPSVLRSGRFVSHEHATSGAVRVLALGDGTQVLRLEGLDTSDGPDLHVWLSDQPVVDGPSGWSAFDDGAYVDLGSLKGNRGNQNYALPPGVDLSRYRSVSIWCARFHVSFGAAELTT
jgi:hypothetical protein